MGEYSALPCFYNVYIPSAKLAFKINQLKEYITTYRNLQLICVNTTSISKRKFQIPLF